MENFSHYLHENTSYFQKIDKLYTKLNPKMCIMPIQTSRYYFIFLMIATDVAVNDFQKISITLNPMASKWFVWWIFIFQNKKAEIKAFLISAFRKIRNLTENSTETAILFDFGDTVRRQIYEHMTLWTSGKQAHTSAFTVHIWMNITIQRDFYGTMP